MPGLLRRARSPVDALRGRVDLWRLRRRLAGPRLLRGFADEKPDAFFVEVGANDGEKHDFVRPFVLERSWRGIMVEPVPHVFERLTSNYEKVPGVLLANTAIGPRDGEMPFYYVADPPEHERDRLPEWYDGIGSFSRDAVASHSSQIPDIEDRIVRIEIPVTTFELLFARYGIGEVDLLVIDTEGYDWELLQAFDFQARQPTLVVYEHFHLSPSERRDCAAFMRAAGYRTLEEGFDTFCLHQNASARLNALFSGLQPAVAAITKEEEAAAR